MGKSSSTKKYVKQKYRKYGKQKITGERHEGQMYNNMRLWIIVEKNGGKE